MPAKVWKLSILNIVLGHDLLEEQTRKRLYTPYSSQTLLKQR
jgi:hypothetical protein